MAGSEIVVGTASAQDLDGIIAMLDGEFIYRKGRTLSLAKRFPGVYCLGNIGNIFVVKDAGRIMSSVVVKRGKWLAGKRQFEFAAIGGVYTDPSMRGHGLALAILRGLPMFLHDAGADFAVLWTTINSFYESLGWCCADCGLFGILQRRFPGADAVSVICTELALADAAYLESVRACWLASRMVRGAVDYRNVPIPAETVECFRVEDGLARAAYAIVGRRQDVGYVYEMIGAPDTFSTLWAAVGQAYETIYVNDYRGSPSAQWLDAAGAVSWLPQHLAMWQSLSPHIPDDTWHEIYISFLDRI